MEEQPSGSSILNLRANDFLSDPYFSPSRKSEHMLEFQDTRAFLRARHIFFLRASVPMARRARCISQRTDYGSVFVCLGCVQPSV